MSNEKLNPCKTCGALPCDQTMSTPPASPELKQQAIEGRVYSCPECEGMDCPHRPFLNRLAERDMRQALSTRSTRSIPAPAPEDPWPPLQDRHTAQRERDEAEAADERARCHFLTDAPSTEGLIEALKLFACLEIPAKPEGNAGFYSIPFERIERARAALSQSSGEGL